MAVSKNIYYEFLDFHLDVKKKQLLKNGEPVQLTPKVFQLLLLLVESSGKLVKKEDIFEQLWMDSFVEEANLTQNIYVLRKVLGKDSNGTSYIQTIPKQGYRLNIHKDEISTNKYQSIEIPETASGETKDFSGVQPEQEINKNVFEGSMQLDFEEIPLNAGKPENLQLAPDATFSEKKSKHWLRVVVLFSLLMIGIIAATATIYYFRHETQQHAATYGIKSIAILPFNSIGEESDKAKLGLGMADAVITQLSKLQIIEVRPTSTVFRYADQPSSNPIVSGRELEVDTVLEGAVQTDGERIRVSVNLIRVADGNSLWAETFHEKASDVLAIQDLISKRVVAALSLKLTPRQEQKLTERGTSNNAAYQNYQLGVYFWNKRTKDGLLSAIEYFQQAIELDSNYAQAYAGLADCYSLLAYYNFADVNEMKEKAKITAEKALALNDSLAEAYAALGIAYILKGENPARGLELHSRAVELAPYNASVRHRYGMSLYWNGKLDEAVEQLRWAKEYDPPSAAVSGALCNILIRQRNFSDAVIQCEKAAEISVSTLHIRTSLARAYFYDGRHADALNQLDLQIEHGTESEKVFARGKLAYFYAKLGQTTEAEKIYTELKQKFEKDPSLASDLALISFELGKKDEALFYFREMLKSLDEYADLSLSLAYDPFWDDVRKDPQFAPLFPKTNHLAGTFPSNL